jgi:hypothetical protein
MGNQRELVLILIDVRGIVWNNLQVLPTSVGDKDESCAHAGTIGDDLVDHVVSCGYPVLFRPGLHLSPHLVVRRREFVVGVALT